MKKAISLYFLFYLFSSLSGCNDFKAGNRVTLDYVIYTNIDQDIIKKYLDTLIKNQGYDIPPYWRQYNKLVDLIPENTRRVYFKSNPQEMYLIQFNAVLLLADVYNPSIVDGDYIATPDRMPKGGEERVTKRFKEEILDKIEQMAKHDGYPDSVLYFKTKYVNGKWTTIPKWP